MVDDFVLISLLESTGSCDKAASFLKEPDSAKTHPLLIAMNQYLRNTKVAIKTVEFVFAKFLVELSRVSNDKFYGMCAAILRALYDCLNLYGYHFIIKLEQQNKMLGKIVIEDSKQDAFCEKEGAEFISIIFDFFVRVFLKNYLRSSDFEFDFVIKFLKYFNSWLFKYNFSKIEVSFNSCN